ncbi:MAG: cytochrome c biogenesis protein CcdA [Ruthenibacterium sp.]
MNFSIETGFPVFTVLLQGLFSFFSPCVLPLVPLYMGYLAGGAKDVDENGIIHYNRRRVLLNTLFFVIGISFAFFALGFGFTTLGRFLSGNRMVFARIGGILVILFGLYQVGFLNSRFLSTERRLPFRLDKLTMNPAVALLFGFTFSFAWTPCVGPALASVLLLASSASSSTLGYVLIGVYTLGFVIPFLLVGLFTGSLLNLFKKHQKIVAYTVKAGGILLIVMGIMMFTGWMNGVTGYLSGFTSGESAPPQSASQNTVQSAPSSVAAAVPDSAASSQSAPAKEPVPAPDFTLTDQNNVSHTLSDYRGKVVFLNFMATWCGPCKGEIPDIQSLYTEKGENAEDFVVLAVTNPKTADSPNGQDVTVDKVIEFAKNSGVTYPIAMDTTGDVFAAYGIRSFPTTFMIDVEGNVFGYVAGALTRETMDSIVEQTIANVPAA